MKLLILNLPIYLLVWSWPTSTFISTTSTFIAAVSTVIYTVFTYRILSATKNSIDDANRNRAISNKLAEFQIYSKLSDSLSSEKALKLFDIIEDGNFFIEELMDDQQKKSINNSKSIISGKEFRRYVLSPIEDLAKFKDDGLITLESIDSGFGNTILMVGNCKQVVDYIIYLRSRKLFSENILCGFETLYSDILNNCSEEEKIKYADHFTSK